MSLASLPCWDLFFHSQWPQQLPNRPASTCSHTRKLPAEQWTVQDGIASGEKRDKEEILPARDFQLRKACCGKAGLQPALLGSEEPPVLLRWLDEDEECVRKTGLTLGCVTAG